MATSRATASWRLIFVNRPLCRWARRWNLFVPVSTKQIRSEYSNFLLIIWKKETTIIIIISASLNNFGIIISRHLFIVAISQVVVVIIQWIESRLWILYLMKLIALSDVIDVVFQAHCQAASFDNIHNTTVLCNRIFYHFSWWTPYEQIQDVTVSATANR